MVIWEVMTFFFGFHFIALNCGGHKFGLPRGGVKFAKSSPPISKNGKKWSILQIHPPNAQHRFAPLSSVVTKWGNCPTSCTPCKIVHKSYIFRVFIKAYQINQVTEEKVFVLLCVTVC